MQAIDRIAILVRHESVEIFLGQSKLEANISGDFTAVEQKCASNHEDVRARI